MTHFRTDTMWINKLLILSTFSLHKRHWGFGFSQSNCRLLSKTKLGALMGAGALDWRDLILDQGLSWRLRCRLYDSRSLVRLFFWNVCCLGNLRLFRQFSLELGWAFNLTSKELNIGLAWTCTSSRRTWFGLHFWLWWLFKLRTIFTRLFLLAQTNDLSFKLVKIWEFSRWGWVFRLPIVAELVGEGVECADCAFENLGNLAVWVLKRVIKHF
jgi:hypothetical protein